MLHLPCNLPAPRGSGKRTAAVPQDPAPAGRVQCSTMQAPPPPGLEEGTQCSPSPQAQQPGPEGRCNLAPPAGGREGNATPRQPPTAGSRDPAATAIKSRRERPAAADCLGQPAPEGRRALDLPSIINTQGERRSLPYKAFI
ncbi:unnamed protein product [Caretta caretta]